MKKLISVIIALLIALALTVPALTAEATKPLSNAERAQALIDNYGFTDYAAYSGMPWDNPTKPLDEATEAKALTVLENAFVFLGTSTTKTIFKPYLEYAQKNDLSIPLEIFNLRGVGGAAGYMKSPGAGGLSIHATPEYIVPINVIVHETMHAFDYGTGTVNGEWLGPDKCAGSNAMLAINGDTYRSALKYDSNQYINIYAQAFKEEDFAYTAENMIMRGGESPCTLSQNTVLYKKYVACYKLFLEHFGSKSNIVRRSAAFLSIELPVEK
jgi:hypothetical protein